MAKDRHALVWMDLEMTGLDPDKDQIIEMATIITDADLNIVSEGPVLAVYQEESVLDAMDEWNTRTHTTSGLVERVRTSGYTETDAEELTLEFIRQYIPKNRSPLCGNSICQDRRFLHRNMPRLESYLHYRNLDVSSIKELVVRWRPSLSDGFHKKNTHQALDDIRESIDELRYYREHFFRLD
ncbi:MAG TPA: oligoribonuclease [Gammaproteobacteria bacterium]|nr:oligoribonuclease [Gammaproteobacteria bacterium]